MKITKLFPILLLLLTFSCDKDDDSVSVSPRVEVSSNVVLDILDNQTVESTISLDSNLGTFKDATKVAFELNLSHDYVGDLLVEVIAPNGRVLPLIYDFGSSNNLLEDNILVFNSTYTDTLAFDEEAGVTLAGNYAPSLYEGYTPDWTMSTFFTDLSAGGIWTLRVTDEAGGDEGQIHGWTIRIEEGGLNL